MTDPYAELVARFHAATHFIASDGHPAIRVLTDEQSADVAFALIEELLDKAKEEAMAVIIDKDWDGYKARHAAEYGAYFMADTISAAVTREPL